jgi:hypothetical protein
LRAGIDPADPYVGRRRDPGPSHNERRGRLSRRCGTGLKISEEHDLTRAYLRGENFAGQVDGVTQIEPPRRDSQSVQQLTQTRAIASSGNAIGREEP